MTWADQQGDSEEREEREMGEITFDNRCLDARGDAKCQLPQGHLGPHEEPLTGRHWTDADRCCSAHVVHESVPLRDYRAQTELRDIQDRLRSLELERDLRRGAATPAPATYDAIAINDRFTKLERRVSTVETTADNDLRVGLIDARRLAQDALDCANGAQRRMDHLGPGASVEVGQAASDLRFTPGPDGKIVMDGDVEITGTLLGPASCFITGLSERIYALEQAAAPGGAVSITGGYSGGGRNGGLVTLAFAPGVTVWHKTTGQSYVLGQPLANGVESRVSVHGQEALQVERLSPAWTAWDGRRYVAVPEALLTTTKPEVRPGLASRAWRAFRGWITVERAFAIVIVAYLAAAPGRVAMGWTLGTPVPQAEAGR